MSHGDKGRDTIVVIFGKYDLPQRDDQIYYRACFLLSHPRDLEGNEEEAPQDDNGLKGRPKKMAEQ